ncbi:butyrate kinase [Gudongella sp. SC589]|jgi:butyrate kinase|uniref:butyrate kinase n=1 Tax=Gudongella sp. SC589 TaxID=3385990 RepID=UPI00390483C7
MLILTINPGGTSTKIGLFQGEKEVFKKSISHIQEDLENYETVFHQFAFRKSLIEKALAENNYSLDQLGCVVGRGGLMKPVEGGIYPVNDRMLQDLEGAINGEHASNLGAVLAKAIGDELGVPSLVVDPVSVDEFQDVSRITGISDIEKASWLHSLNHKAVARKTAAKLGGDYKDFNFIVAHLGSGISIVAHKRGKMIDGSGGRSDGPFSPERSGGLLAYPLVKLCYSGKYTESEMIDKISNTGGMYDYLGTKDMIEIEGMIESGHKKARLVMDAFVYQVSKEISMYGATLSGQVDRIILTGGIAYSSHVASEVSKMVSYLAPVEIIPGEMEMEALALGAIRYFTGQETPKEYV